jgi:cyclic pyranopterin phosphate synthase
MQRIVRKGVRYNSAVMSEKLTHLDDEGRARMVDVGGKPETERVAIAKGIVEISAKTLTKAKQGNLKKGDLVAVAELAGVMAAKRTAELIPLCHPLPLTHIEVEVKFIDEPPQIEVRAEVRTTARTGVEMEALTAVSVASLTVYDMIKAVEREARITDIRLIEKRGGSSGDLGLE